MFEARVQRESFDIAREQARLAAIGPGIGAIVSFTGQVRDTPLLIEQWPGVAERRLADLLDRARGRWPLLGAIAIHRHGLLAVGDPIVLVLAAARHRGEAFAAAAFLMDYLKTEAPFWKKEGADWVTPRTADDAAVARWEAP